MKIIGSDYDGTLNHKGIDDCKRRAISSWRKAGNVFAIVSGRPVSDLIRFSREHGFECDFFVGYNGAVIADSEGKIVSSAVCDGNIAGDVISHLISSGVINVYVGTDDAFELCPEKLVWSKADSVDLRSVYSDRAFTQIGTDCIDYSAAENITLSLKECFGDKLNLLQNGTCINIVRRDINKAKGLYILMEQLGAKYEDVIAVGDNVNDRDMIAEFRSYAMENAVPLIKELASDVTPGITQLIEKELK